MEACRPFKQRPIDAFSQEGVPPLDLLLIHASPCTAQEQLVLGSVLDRHDASFHFIPRLLAEIYVLKNQALRSQSKVCFYLSGRRFRDVFGRGTRQIKRLLAPMNNEAKKYSRRAKFFFDRYLPIEEKISPSVSVVKNLF